MLANFRDRIQSEINSFRTRLARLGLDPFYRKVFAIGFNKTATSSIHVLFDRAGLRALHKATWGKSDDVALHAPFQAFSDGGPHCFESLDRLFPRSRFILNVRDLDEWIDSRLQHIRFNMERGTHQPSRYWYPNETSVRHWLHLRNQYHLRILRYFADRPTDLLVVNFIRAPDAAMQISNFIGRGRTDQKPFSRPIPKTRDAGTLVNRELIERCFEAEGISPSERRMDIYCPSLVTDESDLSFPGDTACLTKRNGD